MKVILSGTMSINLFLEFLHRNNHTDKLVLKNIKAAMESRSSVVYSSIIISHAFTQAGTTNDFFLRDHLEWLARATNWSKFTATASLGVIQKGHHKESMTILAPYLPQQVRHLTSAGVQCEAFLVVKALTEVNASIASSSVCGLVALLRGRCALCAWSHPRQPR
jgi:hypothetical protein